MKNKLYIKIILRKTVLFSAAVLLGSTINFKSYSQNQPQKHNSDSLVNKENRTPNLAPPELPSPQDQHRSNPNIDTTRKHNQPDTTKTKGKLPPPKPEYLKKEEAVLN